MRKSIDRAASETKNEARGITGDSTHQTGWLLYIFLLAVSFFLGSCGPFPPKNAQDPEDDTDTEIDTGTGEDGDDGDGTVDDYTEDEEHDPEDPDHGPPAEPESMLPGEARDDIHEEERAEVIITAATWNLRQFTPTKAGSTPPPMPGATTMKGAVFAILEHFGVDIAALQESYHRGGTDPFASVPTGWAVIPGPQIFSSTDEYCPIVYQPDDLTCTPVQNLGRWNSAQRGINWVTCTADADPPPKETFFFGCAHFAYHYGKLKTNIRDFFEHLQQAGPGPTVNATSRDNFILGLDANSNGTNGRLVRTWQRGVRELAALNANNGPQIAMEPLNNTGPSFTKFRRFRGAFVTSSRNPVLDELLWHLRRAQPLTYRDGTKRVLNVQTLWASPLGFFASYYPLSDHLPVAADFDVNTR